MSVLVFNRYINNIITIIIKDTILFKLKDGGIGELYRSWEISIESEYNCNNVRFVLSYKARYLFVILVYKHLYT